MLLAIDIGNTNIVVGVFDEHLLKSKVRLTTRKTTTVDEAGLMLSGVLDKLGVDTAQVSRVVLASVVPDLTRAFEQATRLYLDHSCLTITAAVKMPIRINLAHPEQLGADRIANASAAWLRYRQAIIVVDFGTATTLDVVSADGIYEGGIIAPGPETSMKELARRASRLFTVNLEQPQAVVGKSTEEALRSGLFYGTIGQVDYMIDKILEETGFEEYRVIATGGYAVGMDKYSRHIELVDTALTLDGLRLIAEMN